MELYALIYQIIECIGIFFVNIFNGCRDIFQSAARQYRIGDMPTFSLMRTIKVCF